jgi:hypothetical protein
MVSRLVAIGGSGTLRTRLVIGGQAAFRFMSPLGAVRGASVSLSPDVGQPPTPLRANLPFAPFGGRPLIPPSLGNSCGDTTDADGRVTFASFPPGPTRVELRLLNSTHVFRVTVPEDTREIAFTVRDGYFPVRLVNAVTKRTVSPATAIWMSDGVRVESNISGSGEALLEGVGTEPGTLTIDAPGYEKLEVKFAEPPGTLTEFALQPLPPTRVEVRVINDRREPIARAVVELAPSNPLEIGHIAVTDEKGVVSYVGVAPGMIRLVAHADGFSSSMLQVANEKRYGVTITLKRSP